MKVKSESEVAQSCPTLSDRMEAPPSMGFSRQEYWSGVPLGSVGIRVLYTKLCGVCHVFRSTQKCFILKTERKNNELLG